MAHDPESVEEARDPLAPADPSTTQDRETNPTMTLPSAAVPPDDKSDLDGGEYEYWLRDGVTPYRTLGNADANVYSKADGAWMIQHQVDHDKLWPSSAGEIAGMIPGGRSRLTEPTKGAMPVTPGPDEDFAPVESPDLMAEADSEADLLPVITGGNKSPEDAPADDTSDTSTDLPEGGMSEQQIRDAGLRIDLPYDDPLPVALKYKNTGQQAWTPPPGFRQGMPPIDEQLAADLGVPRDLGQSAQEGAEGGSSGNGAAGEPG